MLSTAIIIFREALEISIIIGVILAATKDLTGRMKWIIGGFAGGAAGAGLIALFAENISAAASGMGQELFNAAILGTAALFIGWTALWMKSHAKHMSAHFKKVGQDVIDGNIPFYSLSLVIGLSILREGSEIVLFIYSMIVSGQSSASIASGAALGLVLGVLFGTLFYYGLIKMAARHMLRATGILLTLLVAGLTSQAVGYLSAAGYFSALSRPVWNSAWLLSDGSLMGKTLHSLVGYTAQPSSIQLIFYGGTLLMLYALGKWIESRQPKLVVTLVALSACLLPLKNANALDEIYSPNVEPGEFAVEYAGSRTFDNHQGESNIQGHEFSVEYGFTDRFLGEISGSFAKEPTQSLKMEKFQAEGRWQFFEQGKNWVDSGLLVAYGFSTQSHTPDEVETKLLLQKDVGRITHTANIGFTQAVGSDAQGGPDFVLLVNSRYRYNEMFQPGLELQSDFGHNRTLGHFDQQEHYFGPAVYGKLFGKLRYQAAYLFGISDAAAQGAARISLEYEMHF